MIMSFWLVFNVNLIQFRVIWEEELTSPEDLLRLDYHLTMFVRNFLSLKWMWAGSAHCRWHRPYQVMWDV